MLLFANPGLSHHWMLPYLLWHRQICSQTSLLGDALAGAPLCKPDCGMR